MVEEERVEEIENGLMARFRRDTKDMELDYNRLGIGEVGLHFYWGNKKSGTLYDAKGDFMLNIAPQVSENFMAFQVPQSFIEKLVRKAEESPKCEIVEEESTLERFKQRKLQ